MKGYIFGRPTTGELSLPGDDFIWEGPDGSRIQGHRLFGWYCTPEGTIDRRFVDILGVRSKGQKVVAAFFGVGDHGGGPTAEMLEQLDKELNAKGVHLAFAELRDRLQDLTLRYGLFDTLDRDHFYPTLKAAVREVRALGSLPDDDEPL